MFDYSKAMSQVIADIAANVSSFRHIQPDRIWTAVSQSRTAGVHGVYASVLPMRFRDGEQEVVHRGIRYVRRPVFNGEKEILYVIIFYLPRFCDLSFEHKLKTIFHELFHVSPEFNGDIRRFPGRKFAHGTSREKYDERLSPLIEAYLATRSPSDAVLEFLAQDFESLMRERGRVFGRRALRPPCRRG